MRGGDVQEDQLVGEVGVVARRQLGGIARVAEVHEAGSLDDATGIDVEAGNNAPGQTHDETAGKRRSASSSESRPS